MSIFPLIADLQIGVYELLERQLAGILLDHLRMEDIREDEKFKDSKKPIPVKDVYYQLINNNVLSLSHMGSEEASPMEQQLHQIPDFFSGKDFKRYSDRAAQSSRKGIRTASQRYDGLYGLYLWISVLTRWELSRNPG